MHFSYYYLKYHFANFGISSDFNSRTLIYPIINLFFS